MKLSLITTLLLAPLTVLHAADFILVTKDTPPAPIIGFKGGTAYGETDEFGANAVVNPVSVHDIHATILHQMGLDHTRLTFRHGGRDQRLTDVHGHVINEILA